jgi:hypothetical protein
MDKERRFLGLNYHEAEQLGSLVKNEPLFAGLTKPIAEEDDMPFVGTIIYCHRCNRQYHVLVSSGYCPVCRVELGV